MKKIIIISILSLIFSTTIAQENNEVKLNLKFIKSGFTDTKDLIISPVYWKSSDYLIAGSIITGGLILYTFDDDIQKFAQKYRTPHSNHISKYGFEPIGSGLYSLSLVGGFYIYGVLAKNNRYEAFGLNTGKALAINGVITLAVKHLSQRHRPNKGPDVERNDWNGPFSGSGSDGFFSGHTMLAFTIATAFAQEFKEYKWVPYTAYSFATLAGISRIHDNKHWATDVLFGAAFGYFSTRFIFRKNNKIHIEPVTQYIYDKPVTSVRLSINLN